MDDVPLRRACNRCRVQKLSCRRNGTEACERCVRLGRQCTSSPSLRYGRKRGDCLHVDPPDPPGSRKRRRAESDSAPCAAKSPPVAPVSHGGTPSGLMPSPASMQSIDGVFQSAVDLQLGLDDSSYFLSCQDGGVFVVHPSRALGTRSGSEHDAGPSRCAYQQQGLPDPTVEGPGPAQATRRRRKVVLRPQPEADACARRLDLVDELADMGAHLRRLQSSVPYLAASERDSDIYQAYQGGHGSQGSFPIDSMFMLSKRLLQSLGSLVSACVSSDPRAEPRAPGADPGTWLLVLSICIGLLNLYRSVFQNMQRELPLTGSGDTFKLCRLPDVTVGSFAVPRSPGLQVGLALRLAEEFLSRLREAAVSLRLQIPPAGVGQPPMFTEVVDVSLRELLASERDISLELDNTRAKLAGMPAP